ncbi:MAG: 6-bladed beta-propeller [Bacteroidales bacterium]|nr:6-bladed beta-propeller [Bacteroidales bacterium]
MFSCKNEKVDTGTLPVIDFATAYKVPIEPHPLSEFVEHIEYVKLETKPECFVKSVQGITFSKNFIALYEYPSKRIMIFTKEGKYVNDIGSFGKGPGEYNSLSPTSIIISPNEKYLALRQNGNQIYLYDLDGTFRGSTTVPSKFIDAMVFDHSGALLVYQQKLHLPDEGGYMILKYDESLSIIDSLMFHKPDKSALGAMHVNDAMITYEDDMYFRQVFNDTVYKMTTTGSVEPTYIINLGDMKLPSFKPTRQESLLKYLCVEYIHLSDQYFLIKLSGKARNPKPNSGAEELVWYNRQTKDVIVTYPFFKNDLDGINEHRMAWPVKNGGFWDYVNVIGTKQIMEDGSVNVEDLTTPKYYGKLKELLAVSDIEDNPIIRIFYVK